MLEKLKTLYPAIPDELLTLLLENAESFICDYCNLAEYSNSLDSVLFKMVQEDLTKVDAQGMSSESAGGVSVSYTTDYSQPIYKSLNRHKKIKLLG